MTRRAGVLTRVNRSPKSLKREDFIPFAGLFGLLLVSQLLAQEPKGTVAK
jgi:hypothetical protein